MIDVEQLIQDTEEYLAVVPKHLQGEMSIILIRTLLAQVCCLSKAYTTLEKLVDRQCDQVEKLIVSIGAVTGVIENLQKRIQ